MATDAPRSRPVAGAKGHRRHGMGAEPPLVTCTRRPGRGWPAARLPSTLQSWGMSRRLAPAGGPRPAERHAERPCFGSPASWLTNGNFPYPHDPQGQVWHPIFNAGPPAPLPATRAEARAPASREPQRGRRQMLSADGHSLLGHKLPKRGRSCGQCKALKLGCSGHAPCTRCWRLALRCVPQAQAGGGQGSGGCGSSGSCGGVGNGSGNGGALREDVDEDDGKQVAGGLGAAAPSATGLPGLLPPPPPGRLMRVVIERLDPRPIAKLVAQAFIDRHRDGLVVRDNAVRILRHWGWKNALCGCMDASWGALGEVMTEIGLTPAELEEPEVPWAMPANTRSRGVGRAEAEMKAAHAQIPAMQQTAAFREAERHDAAVYMVAPWGVDGRLVEASNDLFRERLRGVEEIYSDMMAANTLSELLLCALVAPEDRLAFVGALLDVQLTCRAPRVQQIVKAYNTSTGDIELNILEARPAQTLPDGTPLGLLLRLERCPPSKYLSGCRLLNVVKTFRTMERLLTPPSSPTAGSPLSSPSASCNDKEEEEEEQEQEHEQDSDEERDGALDGEVRAADISSWETTVLPGAASMAFHEQAPPQSELSALLVARLPRESLAIFKRHHPCAPRGLVGGLLPPSPLPVRKRQPSAFEWTRPATAPPAPAPPTPTLQLEVGATALPAPAEGRSSIGSWGQRASSTPGGAHGDGYWGEGQEAPIFDDELLLALFD